MLTYLFLEPHFQGPVCAIKKLRASSRLKHTLLRYEAAILKQLDGHPAIPKLPFYFLFSYTLSRATDMASLGSPSKLPPNTSISLNSLKLKISATTPPRRAQRHDLRRQLLPRILQNGQVLHPICTSPIIHPFLPTDQAQTASRRVEKIAELMQSVWLIRNDYERLVRLLLQHSSTKLSDPRKSSQGRTLTPKRNPPNSFVQARRLSSPG